MLRRLAQVYSFMRKAQSCRDAFRFAILGVARGHPFSADTTLARWGRKFWPSITVRPKGFRGAAVNIDPRDLGQLISFQEIIVEQGYDFALVPFEPTHILDCGAHIGLFAVSALKRYPAAHIMAFEPNPANIAMIRRQIAL